MIRISPVNYTNTYPLIHFLPRLADKYKIEIQRDIPSSLIHNLLEGKSDLALLPVASLLHLDDYQIVGQHGIASDDEVASVCLYSRSPIEGIEEVYLDYQSRTSVQLLKWLMKNFWDKNVQYLDTEDDAYFDFINGKRAGLIIGDRALEQNHNFPFVYDLVKAWKKATGLPFVFARWVSIQKLADEFIADFELIQEDGLEAIAEIIESLPSDQRFYDMHKYYTENIQYRIDEAHEMAMKKFLSEIQ